MSIENINQQDLRDAHFANLRNNQIGGETDGWPAEAAADAGYTVSLEEVDELYAQRRERERRTGQAVLSLEHSTEVEDSSAEEDGPRCGDCGALLANGCVHVGNRRSGRRYTRGN